MTADLFQEQVADAFGSYNVEVTEQEIGHLVTYLELIEHWNEKMNLTAIRDRSTAIMRHLVEPVMVRDTLAGSGPYIVDAGSGVGVPGIPMAIVDKQREIVLVEANNKKATFLHEVVDKLELQNVRVLEERLEEAIAKGSLEGPVHVLVSRGWTSGWGSLLGQMAPLMAPGGRAILLTGEETQRALRRQLAQGSQQARVNVPEWRDAARAGWTLRRARPLPHLNRGYMVTLELPTP
jgi:16S rRNA (guanine527-N7)-methyltransferase